MHLNYVWINTDFRKYFIMITMSLKIPKIATLTVSVLTLWVLLFGLTQFNMDMTMGDGMVNCPFGGHSMSICKMNPMEHIQEWQSMFTMIPAKDALSFLSALLALLALLAIGAWKKFSIHNQPWPEIYINPFYLRRSQIFNPLKEAFSSGILNPKIF